jgi:hypothetical protein
LLVLLLGLLGLAALRGHIVHALALLVVEDGPPPPPRRKQNWWRCRTAH